MKLEKYTVTLTTNSGGAGSTYSPLDFPGLIYAIRYKRDATNPFSAGAVLTVDTTYDAPIWSGTGETDADKIVYPRARCHDQAGAEVNILSGVEMACMIPHAAGYIFFDITGGGNTKTGQFEIIMLTEFDPAMVVGAML